MNIWPTWHHRYPKVDLEGRHFGDLHPLCSITSFASHGAEYDCVIVADVSGSLTLDADSALFAAIRGSGSECTKADLMVLNETFPCTGAECSSGVSHVKVGSVVYKYYWPPCFDLFFDPHPVAANDTGIRTLDGEWQEKSGTPIRDGDVHLDMSNETVKVELFASGIRKHGVYVASGRRTSTRGFFAHTNRAVFGGQKPTHLDTILLILRVHVDNGLHLRKLE